MTMPGQTLTSPPPSAAVAAAEAEIAETRRNLDAALDALRRDLALPIAAVMASAALLGEGGEGVLLRDFMRRNALPLGLIGMGAAWLAVENRGTLGALGRSCAREFLERARALGRDAAEAALSVALDEIGGPAGEARQTGGEAAPGEPSPAGRALGDSDQDRT